MFSLRIWVVLLTTGVIVAQLQPSAIPSQDYLDDVKEYAQHNADEAAKRYREKINKVDMLEDYPKDHDYDDYDEDEDYEEDYDEDEEDDDDDADDAGGCGGGDDDDEEDDDEELNPVQQIIEEFFTR